MSCNFVEHSDLFRTIARIKRTFQENPNTEKEKMVPVFDICGIEDNTLESKFILPFDKKRFAGKMETRKNSLCKRIKHSTLVHGKIMNVQIFNG